MARLIMFQVKSAAIREFLRGSRTFKIFGITITIQHAHDNEYQVILPDKSEFLRLIDMGNNNVRLYEV